MDCQDLPKMPRGSTLGKEDRMDAAPRRPVDLRPGGEYEMDIVGATRDRGLCYGWVNKGRVFIAEYCPPLGFVRVRKKEDGAQPGDRVAVRIDGLSPTGNCAYATVLENRGFVLHEKHPRVITLTGRCMNDARDAVSDPGSAGADGGFLGVFTQVRRAKYMEGNYAGNRPEVSVTGKTNKKGRYIATAELTNARLERPVEREVYVGQWGTPSYPNLELIRKRFGGIPGKIGAFLYFPDETEKEIVTPDRTVYLSARSPAGVVDYFYAMGDPRAFRLALATQDGTESLMAGIENSSYRLAAEWLPLCRRSR